MEGGPVTIDDENAFYSDCPHCDRNRFQDGDDWFEHVSMCGFEQVQERVGEEEE